MADFSKKAVGFVVNDSESVHTIFFKRHVVREHSELTPSSKTLFTLGWPPYATESKLEDLYSSEFGPVSKVYLKKAPGPVTESQLGDRCLSFKVAYVVFESEESLDKVLAFKCGEKLQIVLDEADIGMGKWTKDYMNTRVEINALMTSSDEFMKKYDFEQKTKEENLKALQEPDKEGWVTVVSKRKRLPPSQDQLKESKKSKKRKKKNELLNFYSFQQRELQREHIAQLRKKFEEDKKKVLELKAKRKFRPF